MSKEHAVNTGKRVTLGVTPNGANFEVVTDTQLLSARHDRARQWVITLMQPVTGRSGVNPWVTTFDGTTPYPPGTGIMTAPVLPVGTSLQCLLRWGAGGIAFSTRFDYPLAGGTFGVTGDTLDLSVTYRGAAPVYNAEDLVPVVGGFMVEGLAADPTPLRWRELDPLAASGVTTIAAGADAFWGVKPFARRVRLASSDIATRYLVEFLDTAGASLWTERINLAGIGDARVITVPAAASVMRIVSNSAGSSSWAIEWEIGLT